MARTGSLYFSSPAFTASNSGVRATVATGWPACLATGCCACEVAGTMTVLGLDPLRDANALRLRIGVQHQEAQLQKRIKVWEAVELWASLYDSRRVADVDMLLERLGLAARRNARFMTLSGGQKQRLFIALALIPQPHVRFLRE